MESELTSPHARTSIIVKFDLHGVHAWPDAPSEYHILAGRHAHIFHFEVSIPVSASRQIEFLEARTELIRIITNSYGSEPCDFRGMSCEQLAASVWRSVCNRYNLSPRRVAVYEDTFVGAELEDL